MGTPPAIRAVILAVDDDPAVGRAIERDLRHRYGSRHRVLLADSGEAGLRLVEQVVRRGEPVALLVADQRMPGMSGVEFLARALKMAPHTKRVLLTAYADTEAAIRAINELRLDHYLMKPWSPPESRLYPVLDDLLEDWEADSAARLAEPGLRLVGHRFSAEAHATRDFVARNGVPYRWLDIADARGGPASGRRPARRDGAAGARLRGRGGAGTALTGRDRGEDRPAHGGGAPVLRPRHPRRRAGRAGGGGLRGVRGAADAPRGAPRGGRAGGAELADRELPRVPVRGERRRSRPARGDPGAAPRARRCSPPARCSAIRENGPARVVTLDGGAEIGCHSVLVATGVHYSRLDAPGVEALTGSGVYYGAAPAEAAAVEGEDVVVVGAANSAGQAVVDLATRARRVVVLCRAEGLEKSMSRYLVERIGSLTNVEVMTHAVVTAASGEGRLEELSVEVAGREERLSVTAAFVFIGAQPQTDWLGDAVARDAGGFIVSGPAREADRGAAPLAGGARSLPPRDQPARRLRGRGRARPVDQAGGLGGG